MRKPGNDNGNKMRRARWPLVLAGLAVAILCLVLLAPSLIDPNRYRGQLASLISDALGGEVRLGTLTWGFDRGFWLHADSLSLRNGTLLPIDLQSGSTTVKVALSPLLHKDLQIDKIKVADLSLTVRLETTPASPTTPAQDDSDSGMFFNDIRILDIGITGGKLLLQDKREEVSLPADIQLSGIDLTIKSIVANTEASFNLGLRLDSPTGEDWGRLKGSGSFFGLTRDFGIEHPELRFHAQLDELDTRAQQLFLMPDDRVDTLGGKLSLTAQYDGDLGDKGTVACTVDLDQFSYRDPTLWQEPLRAKGGLLDVQLAFDPRQLAIEHLKLALGDITAHAGGTIENWMDTAVLQGSHLQAELPLLAVESLVPWVALGQDAPVVRDLLQGGGTIRVDSMDLPELSLTQMPEDTTELLQQLAAHITLSGLAVKSVAMLPPVEGIGGQLQLREGTLRGDGLSAQVGPLSLPVISLQATQLLGKPRISVTAKGPAKLSEDSGPEITALLSEHGLRELSGLADVDFKVHYDQARPERWDAKGSVRLEQVKLRTVTSDSKLLMHGKVHMRRTDSINLWIEEFSGVLNGTPVKMDGEIWGIGGGEPLVDIDARTSGLQLAPLAEFLPALADSGLKGILDADLSIYFSYNRPKATRLKGSLSVDDLAIKLPGSDVALEQFDSRLKFSANRIGIEKIQGRVNDQAVSVTGHLMPLPHLTGELHLSSSQIDFDKLFPAPVDTPAASEKAAREDPETAAALPEPLRSASVLLSVELDKGLYRGVHVQDLNLKVDYETGRIDSYQLATRLEHGIVSTRGTVDLNNLQRIPFDINFSMEGIKLEKALQLSGIEPPTPSGTLSTKGHLKGHTGDDKALMRSLRGAITLAAGPGKIPKVGDFGKLLFNVLSVINVEGLLKGQLAPKLAREGVPYDSFSVDATFLEKGIQIDQIAMLTPALSSQGSGMVNMVDKSLDMESTVVVLGTLDKALGMIPLIGDAAASVTKAYLVLKGPLDKPEIRVQMIKGILKSLEESSRDSLGTFSKDIDGSKKKPQAGQ